MERKYNELNLEGMPQLFDYAQLDEKGFCIGVSTLSSKISDSHMIPLEIQDTSYINRKYSYEFKEWLDEYKEIPPDPISEVDEAIHSMNTRTITIEDDSLINMDMLIGLDEKLNIILEHLGL